MNGVWQERLCFRQSLPEQLLFLRHQTIRVLDMQPFAHRDLVGNSYEVFEIKVPIELNPAGFQSPVPRPLMNPLAVGQDAVEIEQQRVKVGVWRVDQAIIIP